MWSTVRQNRPCLVAPGLGLYELHDDAVIATPFRGDNQKVVEDTYWRSVLPLFLQHRGAQALHASAVLGTGGVVGICGRAGAGKSTLAYGLSLRGHRLWADDALVVSSIDPPRAMALRGELRLLRDVREYQDLSSETIELGTEGGEEAPLARILVLRPKEQDEILVLSAESLEAGQAFAALAEHAYVFGFEGSKRAMSDAFLALAGSVPVHEIVRPKALDRIEECVDLAAKLIASGAD